MKYCERIKAYRREAGYTQEEVARKLGCTPEYICMIERGKSPLQVDRAVKMAALYGVTLNKLLGIGKDKPL